MKYISKLSDIYNIVINHENNILENENPVYLSTIKRFILFDFAEYQKINTFELNDLQIDYICCDKFSFEVNDNNFIIINDGENKKITINFDESKNTLVYCKSGYLNDTVLYLINKFIEKGFLVINNPKDVKTSSNKLLTCKLLDEKKIRQPKYCIVNEEDVDKDADKNIFENIIKGIYNNADENNQYVCKILDGHGGHGVFICNQKNILSILQCIFVIMPKEYNHNILIQEKLDFEDGDIRAYVLNVNGHQEIVECIMRKKSSGDFRTNISLGNGLEKFELNKDQENFIKSISKECGLVFAGIDLCIEKKSKKMYVIEINGAPGAPTALNIDEEQNRVEHEKFYTKIIKIVDQYISDGK